MKTSELSGVALDWAVAKCEGIHGQIPHYSTDWAQGGPIIERGRINTEYPREGYWAANVWLGRPMAFAHGCGPTLLIAAMRCYVASKLGDEVEIPKELL